MAETGIALAVQRHVSMCRALSSRMDLNGGMNEGMREGMRVSRPVYISPDIDRLIEGMAGAVPLDMPVVSTDLLTEARCFWADRPEYRDALRSDKIKAYTSAYLVRPVMYGDGTCGLLVTTFAEMPRDGLFSRGGYLNFGWVDGDEASAAFAAHVNGSDVDWEDRDQGRDVVSAATYVLAALMWMRDRIVLPERVAIERHARKRLTRQFGRIDGLDVVKLRLAEPRSSRPRAQEHERYSHWLRRGHFRRLGKTVVSVRPHLCGPLDKPFLPPKQRVYAAVR